MIDQDVATFLRTQFQTINVVKLNEAQASSLASPCLIIPTNFPTNYDLYSVEPLHYTELFKGA